MKKREPISNIMTKDVYTVNENDKLKDAVTLIRDHKIRHIPVMNGKNVSGIISRTDLNRLTFGTLFDNQEGADAAVLDMLSIPQVMTSKPKTVSSTDSIRDVAEIFAKEEYHALPVIDNGELKGIVTTTDLIAYMLEQY
ncbi:MAG: CBS domain-containing protein [Chitinophagaceae bacterium]|nr:MAG: CBS domain-containing protein [Chitinophagaceae bacterium]